MPTTTARKPGPKERLAYRALRSLPERPGEPCGVPACDKPRVTEDCCYDHSLNKPGGGTAPNDGIIDWTAVEVAAQGAREVALTWVEREIAAAMMFSWGYGVRVIDARLGVCLRAARPERVVKLKEMAAEIAKERSA